MAISDKEIVSTQIRWFEIWCFKERNPERYLKPGVLIFKQEMMRQEGEKLEITLTFAKR
jgi:hypothetical protein